MATQSPDATRTLRFGIDLGTDGFVCTMVLNTGAVELLVNEIGSRSTPPVVSFQDNGRHVGQQGADLLASNAANTITDVIRSLDKSYQPSPFDTVSVNSEGDVVMYSVNYRLKDETAVDVSSVEVLAILLQEVSKMVEKQLSLVDATTPAQAHLVLAVPDTFGDDARAHVATAVSLSTDLLVADVTFETKKACECLANAYAHRHKLALLEPTLVPQVESEVSRSKSTASVKDHDSLPATPEATATGSDDATSGSTDLAAPGSVEGQEEKQAEEEEEVDDEEGVEYVAVLDVGRTFSSISVLKQNTSKATVQLVANEASVLGTSNIDTKLATFLCNVLSTKYKVPVKQGSRASLRVLRSSANARKVLSANRTTNVVLEAFGEEGKDYSIPVTRAELDNECSDIRAALRELMQDSLIACGITPDAIVGVELVGGATCIPFVQDTVTDVFGEGKLRNTLDRTSAVAIGAAALVDTASTNGAPSAATDEASAPAKHANYETWLERLRDMQKQDEAIKAVHSARNALEAYAFSVKNFADGQFKQLYNEAATTPFVNEQLDWLQTDEAYEADSADVFTTRQAALEAKVTELNAALFEAMAKDQEEKKKQAEADKQQWAAEAAAAGDKEDHDFRRMKTPERMKYVRKNKDEATELFKGGNYVHATQRFIRALTHSTKFVDLSPEDQEEVNTIQAAIHANLALCYIKQSAWKKAKHSCEESLKLDPTNAKVYYRMALAQESSKDYKEGIASCKKGLGLVEGDAALTKLLKRLEIKKTKAVEAEKKKYAKMFN
eukprot:m.359236 g.359236  ORF g.359236 m.359236 type:complete len:784 (-) comp18484_c0_seq1:280-2631(-)